MTTSDTFVFIAYCCPHGAHVNLLQHFHYCLIRLHCTTLLDVRSDISYPLSLSLLSLCNTRASHSRSLLCNNNLRDGFCVQTAVTRSFFRDETCSNFMRVCVLPLLHSTGIKLSIDLVTLGARFAKSIHNRLSLCVLLPVSQFFMI